MNPAHKNSTWLRALAAATLFAWLTAHVLCAFHCSLGLNNKGPEAAGSRPSCHAAAEGDADSSAPGESKPSFVCLIFKNLPLSPEMDGLVAPDFFRQPVEFVLDLDLIAADQVRVDTRQTWRLELPSTPEVSLGPAFRSLAPPVFA